MNNGENNQNNLSIEPVIETNQQNNIQPVIEPAVNQSNQQPQVTTPPQEEKKEYSLGSNVKIAPATSFYDESGKVNEQPKKEEVKLVQPTPQTVPENTPPQVQMRVQETKVETTNIDNTKQEEQVEVKDEKQKKKRSIFTPLLLLIILGLGGAIYYLNQNYNLSIQTLNNLCSPISTSNETKDLDLNSTIVQDLYSKVLTDIREDYAHNDFDDDLKRYLAFRQIANNKFYESNCNLFNIENIYNYTCDMNNFAPKAFKEENLQIELKKLFGERTNIENKTIQLGRQCVGGYEYIPERGEFVEGNCSSNIAISISVEKKLTKATSKDNIITLTEEVKYIGNEKQQVPEYLQNGIYTYTFKLDTNYNYVLTNREFNTKY